MEYKYKSLIDFKVDYPKEYKILYRKNLLGKICEDMGWESPKPKKIPKPNGYWTFERCMEEALKYNNKSIWKRYSSSSHIAARENGWYEECTEHMIVSKYNNFIKQKVKEFKDVNLKKINKEKKEFSYWTKEKTIEEALKYPFKNRWKQNNPSSYRAAKKNGWFDECISHMVEVKKPAGYWTKERCLETALKFEVISEWRKHFGSSYYAVKENGWYEECTAHMKKTKNKVV